MEKCLPVTRWVPTLRPAPFFGGKACEGLPIPTRFLRNCHPISRIDSSLQTISPVKEYPAGVGVVTNKTPKSLMTFLEGTKTLNWVVGEIRYSGLQGEPLKEVFDNLKDYGDSVRYNEALAACRKHGWLN